MITRFPGLTPTRALGGLGIVSLAVGFAFKDIFENFFAGILILCVSLSRTAITSKWRGSAAGWWTSPSA